MEIKSYFGTLDDINKQIAEDTAPSEYLPKISARVIQLERASDPESNMFTVYVELQD